VTFAVDADHFPLQINISNCKPSDFGSAESSTHTKGEDHGISRTCWTLVAHTGMKQSRYFVR
jgi:hypothetical protein